MSLGKIKRTQRTSTPGSSRVSDGVLSGAPFRIDMPADWNGSLILYCRSWSIFPVDPAQSSLSPALQHFLAQGYAIAQCGYSGTGWIPREAVQDTEKLRRHFVKKHQIPCEVYVIGRSFGGLVAVSLVSSYPEKYSGALAVCAPLGRPISFLSRMFELRALFDCYFPRMLPCPARTPADFTFSQSLCSQIGEALNANKSAGQELRRLFGQKNREIAGNLVFFTELLADIQSRCGGNPFDNRNTIYETLRHRLEVNRSVKRYAADTRCEACLGEDILSSRASVPILAIRPLYDSLVPAWVTNEYAAQSRSSTEGFFVQQYVDGHGHCVVSDRELVKAFRVLVAWKRTGIRPKPGVFCASRKLPALKRSSVSRSHVNLRAK